MGEGGGSRDCPTHKAQQRRKTQDKKLKFTKSLLAAQLQNNIQDVHPHACCLPRSDGRLPQGKHCQDKQDSTQPDVTTAAQEVHKHEANQQQQHMQVKLQGNTSMPSGHIPVYCLCILPHPTDHSWSSRELRGSSPKPKPVQVKKEIEDIELAIAKVELEKGNRDHTIKVLQDEIADQDEVINKTVSSVYLVSLVELM